MIRPRKLCLHGGGSKLPAERRVLQAVEDEPDDDGGPKGLGVQPHAGIALMEVL